MHKKYANDENVSGYKLTILNDRLQTELKLPTLNIMPKVYKLKQEACPNYEYELKGRQIVYGNSTLNLEPSKLLDKMFRVHLNSFVEFFVR